MIIFWLYSSSNTLNELTISDLQDPVSTHLCVSFWQWRQNWPTPLLTCSLPKRSLNKFVSRCEGLFYFITVWRGRLRKSAVITSWREIRSNPGRESCNSVCDPISYQDKEQGKLFRTDKPASDTTLPGYFYVCSRFKKVWAWFAVLIRESDHGGVGVGGRGALQGTVLTDLPMFLNIILSLNARNAVLSLKSPRIFSRIT